MQVLSRLYSIEKSRKPEMIKPPLIDVTRLVIVLLEDANFGRVPFTSNLLCRSAHDNGPGGFHPPAISGSSEMLLGNTNHDHRS